MAESGDAKRLSVERIYQKKTQLEHILLRPDTYIGSVETVTQPMWVYDGDDGGLVHREVTFVPGLYKIFDEILVNAADNKQRSSAMDTLKVDIDSERNIISVYNNGTGIPVVEHKVEKMYVPSLIFGHLLTSSNYNDEEKKVTGGRNGYGAKLCNIFSTKFVVETACKESGKIFKQVWKNNMTSTQDPDIKPFKGEEYTKIVFSPDLSKFKMKTLDKDIVGLMSRRAYDVAGSTRGVKVFLNGKRLPIKGFKEYVEWYLKDKTDEHGNPLKLAYEAVNPRWEVAVTISDKGLQQVSFVNSIATTKGGRHVDYVLDQVVEKILEVVKRKSKKEGIAVKPFQVKSHVWIFVNCLIENPTFDSQTKENMTLQMKNFGSKCILSDKLMNSVQKIGITESVLSWVQFKSQTKLNSKCSTRVLSKLKGIPKLEDANNAGTKHGIECTLILTEGDSAKTLAVSGLGVVGRDNYGVFPLRGKVLNVREASAKQILENAEINNIIKIMGLQYKRKYETREDLQTLRYGRLMIMTDQDQDGSHIKGLLINFIHHNWPSLLRTTFLEEFITPIVKVRKGKEEHAFYSLPEFEEWKTATPDWNKWTTKYYKGLGTSTANEAKEYFTDMERHRIKFKYHGPEDDTSIQLAFSKKMVEQRKEWLTNGMEERKQRKELGLPEIYLYGKETKAVTYQDFVNKELILFSNMDNERSIPSLVDGFKPGMRKVLFTCFKRNLKKEIKVAQLAGSVGEHSAYHHGESSLMTTIINLAQNFVGSNNINLLVPIGQFGTRLQGGKDSASPRYIFTKLSPLARHIFNPSDEPLLNFLHDDNLRIEPEWYIPIIPMVLVNGAEGIGTGWMTKIPNYNPREIVENLKRLLRGEECRPMLPWFKNFKGTVMQVDAQRYLFNGEVSVINEKSIEITELPVRTWTQAYKESVLEPMLHGTDKSPALIIDYKEYNTESTVRFVVSMTEEKLSKSEHESLHKVFKLQTTMSTTSMVLFDHNGCLRKYETVDDILKEFYPLRLEYYVKRKAYLEGMLKAELLKLSNQARFILEKISGDLVIENKKKVAIVAELTSRKYDPDPVSKWKASQKIEQEDAEATSSDEESDDAKASVNIDAPTDFDYLMKMQMWHLSKEKKDKLLAERDQKQEQLITLQKKSPSDLWTADLDAFLLELDSVEQQERDEEELAISKKMNKKVAAKPGSRMKKVQKAETMPSPYARRVEPRIDPELRKKEKTVAAPGDAKKGRKKKEDSLSPTVKSEDTEETDGAVKPLAERVAAAVKRKAAATDKKPMKQSKLDFSGGRKTKKTAKKGNASSSSGSEFTDEELDLPGDSEDYFSSASDRSKRSKNIPKSKDSAKPPVQADQSLLFDSLLDDSTPPAASLSNGKPADKKNGDAFEPVNLVSDDESHSDVSVKSDKASSKPKAAGGASKKPQKGAAPKKPAAPKKSRKLPTFDSDEDTGARKKKPPAKKAPKRKADSSDSDSEGGILPKFNRKRKSTAGTNSDEDFETPRARSARARAPVNYKYDEDSDENDY